jgi:lipopolysaccharide transport system ATP-binding protein
LSAWACKKQKLNLMTFAMNTALEHPSPNNKKTGEVLVRADNVGKIFCRDLKRSLLYGVQDGVGDLIPGVGRKYDANGNPILRKGEFWANQGISFELRRGECLGLIGRNGAGKTTLLKMLNGLIKPDTGRIEMRGKVGAIIALGAGFNPLLTGRENVYIAASVRGLSKKEIDEKYDEIVDFAELHDFMDSPVQNYSSGMQVRLGFAVASIIEPDILIIDEVLAVGDFAFRMKCLHRVTEILKNCSVIFVSHNFDQIDRICTKGAFLENGKLVNIGNTNIIRKEYYKTILHSDREDWLHPDLSIVSEKLSFDHIKIVIEVSILSEIQKNNLCFRARIRTLDGAYVAEFHSGNHKKIYEIKKGENNISETIDITLLKKGDYFVDIFISEYQNDMIKILEIRPFGKFSICNDKNYGYDSVQI